MPPFWYILLNFSYYFMNHSEYRQQLWTSVVKIADGFYDDLTQHGFPFPELAILSLSD